MPGSSDIMGRIDQESSPPPPNTGLPHQVDRSARSAAPPIRVAILGAGRGGTALLDLLHQIPSIEIAGITDRDRDAPGLQRARELQVPVVAQAKTLIADPGVNLIMDVTGDPTMERIIQVYKAPTTDVLGGSASRVLWQLVQHEANLQAELFHAEKLAGIGSFAAGIVHDINNPLQLIMGLAENLAEETDIAVIHEQARDIVEAVRRTRAICLDLTRYSRKSSLQADAIVPVNSRLDEALKIARYAVSLHDLTIVKRYDPEAIVRGNADELLHAFVNLITNAVHAMNEGEGTLTLETQVVNRATLVRIIDTGCGVPHNLLGQIFEPFFTTKAPGKGTGLGLYNVKTIVHQMHGSIVVESQVGVGTTFTLSFPFPQETPS